jgi:flavorubredoxin
VNTAVPSTEPVEIAPDTFLIPNLAAAGEGVFLPVNSMLIRGSEPVIVDTGAPVHREEWQRKVFSLVDPEEVRWIFLSHDDGDHMGSLHDVLALCPNATLVANFFITERLGLERPLPLERMIWREGGETFDAGDRTLRLVVPPIFDGVTTRGLFDESTGAMWAVDSFAAMTPGALHHAADIPTDLFDETFALLNSLVSPWHQWLDHAAYGRHVDRTEQLHPQVVASAHGPVLTGDAIGDVLDRVRAMAGQSIVPPPGQSLLDELIATTLTPAPASLELAGQA